MLRYPKALKIQNGQGGPKLTSPHGPPISIAQQTASIALKKKTGDPIKLQHGLIATGQPISKQRWTPKWYFGRYLKRLSLAANVSAAKDANATLAVVQKPKRSPLFFSGPKIPYRCPKKNIYPNVPKPQKKTLLKQYVGIHSFHGRLSLQWCSHPTPAELLWIGQV